QFGIEFVSRLCERLLAGGAPGFHFYTLNKAKSSESIAENIGFLENI
ncbi:MAG TPA: 5,10-methylenetetrahydrofolate reductase, partial [Gammaproteobacteria bacterium]|nr:5,10-methylenetetrahydrofolate reductase [Gammaproteobacteria bacterium]